MKDILLKDNDLWIRNGDFVIDQSKYQDATLILRLHKGNIKQFPLVGVGEERLINGNIDGKMRREIQLQLEADGIQLKELTVKQEQIGIVL